VLELREEYISDKAPEAIDRDYLDRLYRIMGYAVINLNEEGNRAAIKYGSYSLDVARPPIYIEEYDNSYKLPMQVKITVVKPLTGVNKTRSEEPMLE
jgi:hypothetical protein